MIEGHPERHGNQPLSALCWFGLPGVCPAAAVETRHYTLEMARPATLLVEGVAFLA